MFSTLKFNHWSIKILQLYEFIVPKAGSNRITSSPGLSIPYMTQHKTVYAPALTSTSLSGIDLHPTNFSKKLETEFSNLGWPDVIVYCNDSVNDS